MKKYQFGIDPILIPQAVPNGEGSIPKVPIACVNFFPRSYFQAYRVLRLTSSAAPIGQVRMLYWEMYQHLQVTPVILLVLVDQLARPAPAWACIARHLGACTQSTHLANHLAFQVIYLMTGELEDTPGSAMRVVATWQFAFCLAAGPWDRDGDQLTWVVLTLDSSSAQELLLAPRTYQKVLHMEERTLYTHVGKFWSSVITKCCSCSEQLIFIESTAFSSFSPLFHGGSEGGLKTLAPVTRPLTELG